MLNSCQVGDKNFFKTNLIQLFDSNMTNNITVEMNSQDMSLNKSTYLDFLSSFTNPILPYSTKDFIFA